MHLCIYAFICLFIYLFGDHVLTGVTMMSFWKINHEQELDWIDDPDDLSTFIVVVAVKASEFGFSAYSCVNRSQRKATLGKLRVVGHFTLHAITQFDARTESGVSYLQEEMPVIGRNALRSFVANNSHRSFTYAQLRLISAAADIACLNEQEEELPSVDYLSS